MDKMKENASYFELDNNLRPDHSPIGYPDMSKRDPLAAGKEEPPKRVIYYGETRVPKPRHSKEKFASFAELKEMKLD